MSGRNGKNATEREKELLEVARRYLRGAYQADIGEQLGISRQQVSYDLRVLRERWQKEAAQAIDARKAQELAKVDALETEYWQAWQDSKEERTRTSITREGAQAETVKSARTEREDSSGDPRYLAGVQWCINKRCEIIGLNAPTKQEVKATMALKGYCGISPDDWDTADDDSGTGAST